MDSDFKEKLALAGGVFFRNWAQIGSFLRVAELGIPHARKTLIEETEKVLSAPDGVNESFLEGIKKVGSAGYAQMYVQDAQAAVDAAALIFAHSVLDDAAMKCCRFIALAKPLEWESWVDDKQFVLKEVREHGYDSLFEKALEKRLSKLEYESLLVKADMILRLCKPPDGLVPFAENYVYDRSRLARVDQQRHDVVHGGSWTGIFRLDEDDLDYLRNTGLYFFDLVSVACGLRDPQNSRKVVRGTTDANANPESS